MHILIVTDSYPPLIGGATRAAQQLGRQLVERGYHVSVATAWQHALPEQENDGEIRVFRIRDLTSRMPWLSSDPHRHTPPPFPDPEGVWRFRRLLYKIRPDIVYAYGWLTYSCTAALLGMKTPLVIAARDYGNICALRTLVRHGQVCDGPMPGKCLECATSFYGAPKGIVAVAGVLGGRKLLQRKMRALQSCSGFVQKLMHRYLLTRHTEGTRPNSGKMPDRVIPDFREDTDEGPPDEAILNCLPAEPFILFVGALRLIKGLVPLIAAYKSLDTPPPLVLIGTRSPDTPHSFPPGVTVLYDVPHATVMAAWERALFGVAPSLLPEPLGNVIHEGMSKGKAMIGTTPGGHAEMITEGVTGLLVSAGSTDALAAAMRRLLADPALRIRLGEAARVRAQRFTAAVVMPEFEALFNEVVSVPSNAGGLS